MSRFLAVIVSISITLGAGVTTAGAVTPSTPSLAPPFVPPGTLSVSGAVGGVDPVCKTTTALKTALAHTPHATNAQINSACARFGKPLDSATAARVHRHRAKARSAATALCGNVGCDYIWLLNEGGGWAIAEYRDWINNGCITGGAVSFSRFTRANTSYAFWADTPAGNNGGCNDWFGYRWLYPIAHTGSSWVQASLLSGFEYTSRGYVDHFFPINTWNWITK